VSKHERRKSNIIWHICLQTVAITNNTDCAMPREHTFYIEIVLTFTFILTVI